MDYGAEDVKTRTTAEELATLVRAVAVSPCPVDVHLTPRMSTLVPGGVFIGGVVPRPCRDGFVLVPPPPGAAADILRPRKQPNAFAGNVFRGAGLGVVAAARDGVFALQCWHGRGLCGASFVVAVRRRPSTRSRAKQQCWQPRSTRSTHTWSSVAPTLARCVGGCCSAGPTCTGSGNAGGVRHTHTHRGWCVCISSRGP